MTHSLNLSFNQVNAEPGALKIVRAARFSSAYRYFDSSMDLSDSKKLFGHLYRDEGFGCNFRVEVEVEGRPDRESGMILNLVEIDRALKSVVSQLDHYDLSALPQFQSGFTLEILARWIFSQIKLKGLCCVRLFEGDHTWVEIRGV